jgi:glyoxylase-like metal-dependent hydrolase (beta-lactamase superfamily II)
VTAEDTYTGAVTVGGPIDVRELPALTIAKLAVGPMNNNAYLLRCRATGEGLMIDAAAEPDRLAELARLGGDPVRTIVTTHWHPDHWENGLADAVADTGAQTMAGTPDADSIEFRTDRILRHGDTIQLGEVTLDVIGLRGHTEGSVALHYNDPSGTDHLFTGDSLFPGGVGKTWSPAGFESLYADVVARIFDVYGDDTWFYPGHGDDSTLGVQRPHLEEWRERGW